MRRPEDNSPDPPGGRAEERRREFLKQHGSRDASEAEQETELVEQTRERERESNQGQADSNQGGSSK